MSESCWSSSEEAAAHLRQRRDDHSEQKFVERLRSFYRKYNPQKLGRVEEYLRTYRGREEQLFAILVGKYGPEQGEGTENFASIPSSEADTATVSGKRCRFPKEVSPHEGNTDCVTPYWCGSSLITDRDLLALLHTGQTNNSELGKCFLGEFTQHPLECWNGMTYLLNRPDFNESNSLMGHDWVATLSCSKVLVFEGRKYFRLTLYCSEECQKNGNHERWRVSAFQADGGETSLIRTIFDPVVVPEPLPVSRSNFSQQEAYFSSEDAPTRFSSCSEISGRQPRQPDHPTALVAQFASLLQQFENRINERLDRMENRLNDLEKRE